MGNGRHHDLERPDTLAEQCHGFGKHAEQSLHLADPASRQHQQDRRRGEPTARLLRIGTQFADLSRQGMPDIGAGRPAEPPMDLGLERQQRQDVIDIGAHHPRAPRPPRPHRGRDIFDDRDRGIGSAYPPGDPPREAGAVDDDKDVRAFRHHRLGGKAHQTQDLWDAARNRAKSDDREVVDRIKAGHSFGRHLAAADAGKAHLPAVRSRNARISAAPSRSPDSSPATRNTSTVSAGRPGCADAVIT